jgi:hypothetical protein
MIKPVVIEEPVPIEEKFTQIWIKTNKFKAQSKDIMLDLSRLETTLA